jgi:uncharacterized integral membrane protein
VRGKAKSPADPDQPVDHKRDFRLIGSGIAAGLLLSFGLLNRGTVTIDFWVHHARAPLIVVIVIAGLLGALITTLAHRHRSRRG